MSEGGGQGGCHVVGLSYAPCSHPRPSHLQAAASNILQQHAFVEFETDEAASMAVAALHEPDDWCVSGSVCVWGGAEGCRGGVQTDAAPPPSPLLHVPGTTPTHTHTHLPTPTRTHLYTYTYPPTPPHPHTHPPTPRILTHMHMHTHTHTCAPTHPPTHTHIHTYSHTPTHTRTHTYTHIHTNTHTHKQTLT